MVKIRWNGPSYRRRIVAGLVWEKGTEHEVPADVALELLTLPRDHFEAVDPEEPERLLQDRGGRSPRVLGENAEETPAIGPADEVIDTEVDDGIRG